MTPPEIRVPTHIAGWSALANLLALAGPFLFGAIVEGDGVSLGGAAIAATWTAAPAVAAAGFVGASPSRIGAWYFLALQLLLILAFWLEFVAVRSSSTGGFIFLTFPLLQWSAILLAALFASAFRWRMRPDFLLD